MRASAKRCNTGPPYSLQVTPFKALTSRFASHASSLAAHRVNLGQGLEHTLNDVPRDEDNEADQGNPSRPPHEPLGARQLPDA